jgi:hypothetical protein
VFAVDAFRIDTRDSYDVAAEAPAIAEFEATGRIIIYQDKQHWLDLITGNAAAGRTTVLPAPPASSWTPTVDGSLAGGISATGVR